MTEFDKETLNKLIEIHRRRLAILETQRAQFGSLNVPPHIILEIENEEAEIRQIEEKIGLRRSEIVMSIEELLRERNTIDGLIREHFTEKVAVMFTDMVGYSGYTASKGDIAGRAKIQTHNDLLRPIIEDLSGRIIKTVGDAILACFDEVTKAVLSSVKMQKALQNYNKGKPNDQQIHIRIGLHTGSVITEPNDVNGNTVNIAARVVSLAKGDEILVTDTIHAEAKKKVEEKTFMDRGLYELKGIPGKIQIYAVLWDGGNDGGDEIIIAGRKKEINQFIRQLDNKGEQVHVFWLYGPSGIGKTELLLKLRHIAKERGFQYKMDIIGKGDIGTVLSRMFNIKQIVSQTSEREDIEYAILAEVIDELFKRNTDSIIAIDTTKDFDNYKGMVEYIKYLVERLRSLRKRTFLLIATREEPPPNPLSTNIGLRGLTAEEIKELIEIKRWDRSLLDYTKLLEEGTGGWPWVLMVICRRPDAVSYLQRLSQDTLFEDILKGWWETLSPTEQKALVQASLSTKVTSSSS